jgi:glycosyltransferase involved in cell wall biosynthesis
VPKRASVAFPLTLARSWLSRYPVDLWKWRVTPVRRIVDERFADGRVDLCIADFLFAVVNVPLGQGVPVVLFEHNVEYVIWRRLAALERRPVHRTLLEIEWRKLRRAEAAACTRADLTIAVSEDDRRRLASIAPRSRTTAVPTGVDTSYFKPAGRPEVPGRLVFSGSMDWHPNEDAVIHFGESILPRIRERVPGASFVVVGRNPSTRLVEAAKRTGMELTGTVDDVRPHVDEAAVYVVPLRAGSGTRLKIFEAFAMGKAVVSTTLGAEGLDVEPGRNVILADEPDDFARAVVALLADRDRRQALGHAARALVEERYSWDRVARDFEECCRQVAACDAITGHPALGRPDLSPAGSTGR